MLEFEEEELQTYWFFLNSCSSLISCAGVNAVLILFGFLKNGLFMKGLSGDMVGYGARIKR